MKKHFIILGVIIVTTIVLSLTVKPILHLSSKCFWNIVVTQFDKEEQERIQNMENGEIVRGKDTVRIWGDMYEIGHYPDSNHLEIYINGHIEQVLMRVKIHKVIKKKLYVISEEGYAVINKDNVCKVFITVPKEEFVNGYSVDEQGNKSYYSRFVDNEYIQYLSDFNGFLEEEQENFNKIKK